MLSRLTSVFAATPTQTIGEYGLLGALVILLAGAVVYMFKIILADRNKAQEQRDAVLADVFTKIIPVLGRVQEVLQDRQQLDKELIDAFKSNTKAFDEARIIFQSRSNPGRSGGA